MAAMYSAADFFDLNSFEEARKVIKKMLDNAAKSADKLAESVQKLTEIDKSYTKVLKEKQLAVQSLNADFLSGKQMTIEMQKALNLLSKEILDTAKNVKQIRTENEKLKGNYEAVTKASKELKDSTDELGKQFEGANKKAKEFADGSLAQMKQRLKELKSEYESLGKATDEAVKDSVLTKMRDLSNEIRKEEDLLKNATKATKEQGGAYSQLSAQLNEMRKRYKDMAVSENEASEESKQLLKDIQRLDKQLKDVDASVGQFQRSIGNYQDAFKGLGSGLADVVGSASGLGSIFAGGGAFAAGQVAAELLFTAISETVTSVAELQKNMTEIQTLTKRTGDELIETTSQVKALSNVFEQDFNMTAKASYTLMNTFGESSAAAFDILSRGLAQAGSEGDEFLDNIREYGGNFKELGFTAAQTAGFLSTGIQEGAYKIDKVGDAINNAKIEIQRFDVSSLNSFLKGSDLKVVRDIIQEYQSAPDKMGAGVKAVSGLAKEINRLGVNSKASGELITKVFTAVTEEGLDPKQFFKQVEGITSANKKLTENLTESQLALIEKAQAAQKTQIALSELALITRGTADNLAVFWEKTKTVGAETLVAIVEYLQDLYTEIGLVSEFFGEMTTSITDLFGITEELGDVWQSVKSIFSENEMFGETDMTFKDIMKTFIQFTSPLELTKNAFKQLYSIIFAGAKALQSFKDIVLSNLEALGSDLMRVFNIVKHNLKSAIGYDEFVENFYTFKRAVNVIVNDISQDFNNFINSIKVIFDKGVAAFNDFTSGFIASGDVISESANTILIPISTAFESMVTTIKETIFEFFSYIDSLMPSLKRFLPTETFKNIENSMKVFVKSYNESMRKMTKTDEDRAKDRKKALEQQAADQTAINEKQNQLNKEQQEGFEKALYELRKQRLVFAQNLNKQEATDESKSYEQRLSFFKEAEKKKLEEIELTRKFEISQAGQSTKSAQEQGLVISKINENAQEQIRLTIAETTKFVETEEQKQIKAAIEKSEKYVAKALETRKKIKEINQETEDIRSETADIHSEISVSAIETEISALEKLADAENISTEKKIMLLEEVRKKKEELYAYELELARKKAEKEYDIERELVQDKIDNNNTTKAEKEALTKQLEALEQNYYAKIEQIDTGFKEKQSESNEQTFEKENEILSNRRKMWVEALGGGALDAYEASQQKRINSIEDENEKFKQQILLKVKMIVLEMALKKIADPNANVEGDLAGGLGSLIGTIGGGLYDGGYSGDKTLFIDKNGREATNFVHKNEYIIPEKMVKDPQISPFVSAIDKVRRTNDKSYLFNAGMRANTPIVEIQRQTSPIIDENKLAAKIGAEVAKNIPQTNIMETARTITVSQKQKGMENTLIFDKIRAKMGSGF